ncbi:MAG TPA: hypothetical protein VGG19_20810 [Tepidisphaeraceae bacterium]|jgi:hypothetical protein
MVKRTNFCGLWAFAALAMLGSTAWATNFGVWTSADLSNNYASATMPTAYGYSQGDSTVTISPMTGSGTDYPGLGNYDSTDNGYVNMLNFYPGIAYSAFLPYGYHIEAGTYFEGQSGNLLIQGGYNEIKDTTTFHLDQPTAYSIASGAQIDAEYPPVLTGPGNQSITITGPISGTLAAGDWTLSMDIVGLTQSDWSNGVYDGGHSNTFFLIVPEPTTMALLLPVTISAIPRKRRIKRA